MFFNLKAKAKNVTKNHEGAKAYVMTPQLELYTAVVTASLSDNFYENGGERLNRIVKLVRKNDPEFVAKLAIYTREKMYLRSIPLVLTVELAKIHKGDDLVSRLVSRVVQRADEITELLAYYAMTNNREGVKQLNRLSKQVQKGLAQAFNKFDEYQFSKYDRANAIQLRDALFLTHPMAKDAVQQAIFDKIAARTLATPYTWETELSVLGQQNFKNDAEKQAAFRAKWEELIESGKLGYMALMRNLRNILEANVSAKHIEMVCERLANANEVAKSKQLPFRFLAAYRELLTVQSGYTPSVLSALEDAVTASAANIRGFGYTTAVTIACDVSGSMQKAISAKSKIMLYDVGLMLGMLLKSRCKNAEAGMFGDTWKVINMPKGSVLSNVQAFYKREGEVGYSTNGYLVVQDLLNRRVVKDKVMIFTDVQMWNSNGNKHFESVWLQYRNHVAPNAKLYLFDLAGYGNTPLDLSHARNGVYLIAGWSDKIFDVLAALDEGGNAVKMIESIEM